MSGKGESEVMNFNRDDSTPIRFTPGKEKYSAENNEVGTRPAGDPKSSKNFQKILRKNSDEKDKDGEEKTGAVDGEEDTQTAMAPVDEKGLKPKQAPTSLFELSSHATKSPSIALAPKRDHLNDHLDKKIIADSKNTASATNERNIEGAPESPAMLYSKMSAKEQKKIETPIEQPTEGFVNVNQPIKVEEKKDKFNSRFATEQTDLSYVNPLALNTQPVQSTNFVSEKAALPAINIQDIIDQLVEKVIHMETGDRTDTVITLKRPPILAGADLVVTGFDSAKGEFNITFQKLTQAAKTLLDMHSNQQSLLLALEQKGYAVHIVTTTTLAEINIPTADASPQDRNQKEEGQGQSKQQREDSEDERRR